MPKVEFPILPIFRSGKKRVLFVTGSRADFGKIAPLIEILLEHPKQFEVSIFVTGMHLLDRHGLTLNHIQKLQGPRLHVFENQDNFSDMDTILANTLTGIRTYLKKHETDLIVVHGDRVETMAGALAGTLRNIHVAHIEGGEFSGTIDEALRHAVSKISHSHFTSNQEAKKVLKRMGEPSARIHVIGSPDIDVMKGPLPSIESVKKNCGISFDSYAIAVLHPITTQSYEQTAEESALFFQVLQQSTFHNFIILSPNNDRGANIIFSVMEKYRNSNHFHFLTSIEHRAFITLMKHASFLIGNSSAGIREAPTLGIPSVNLGTRQQGRYSCRSIKTINFKKKEIEGAIKWALENRSFSPSSRFGNGKSAKQFLAVLQNKKFWNICLQKYFKK